MIPVSNEYRRQLIAGNRNYLIKAYVTLADETEFTLTNEEIWEQGVVIDEATSSENSFDIGSAVIGSMKLVVNNISGDYSTYDFLNAKIVLWLGVEGDVDGNDDQIYYRKGFYVVDKPTYNGSLITLECLDNMTWFDVPFSEVTGISYPATAGEVVSAICSHVSVTLGTPQFPNYSNVHTTITAAPESDLNCREVLSYIAQMCCCYCKINTAGELTLTWYDKQAIIGRTDYDGGTYNTTTTPYSDGDDVEGGRWYWDGDTYVWTTTDQYDGGTFQQLLQTAYLSQNYQMEVSTDDIVVTGCRVRNTSSSEDDAYDELWVDSSLEQTHERYVLVIENNPFIKKAKAANIANLVGNTLAGLQIRAFSATSLNDMSYETGDVVTVYDFRGNFYYTWITNLTFTTNNSEQFSCGALSPKQRAETRYPAAITSAEAQMMISDYDNAVKAMDELAQNAIGFYEYVYPDGATLGTARTVYRYDGVETIAEGTADPKFPNSNNVFKISGDGVFVARRSHGDIAADGTCTYSNGYDANSGTAILDLIYAIGLNCNWIHAGTLTLGGNGNQNGWLKILNASNSKIGSWDYNGITINSGSIKLTKQSISDNNSGLYLGSDGIALGPSNAFKVLNNGSVSIKAGMFNQYGDGWLHLALQENQEYTWIFDLASNRCNCMYNDGTWRWVNGGPTELYHYLLGAYSPSDRRYKTDIEELDAEFSKRLILETEPISFKYTYDDTTTNFGVIAQDVDAKLKELGFDEKNGLVTIPVDEEKDKWSVEYKQFVPHLIKVVQEQQKEIDLLKQEVAELKARVE